MGSKIGKFLILCGLVLVLGALALFLANESESAAAGADSWEILSQLHWEIQKTQDAKSALATRQKAGPTDSMTKTVIEGHPYIGFLSIPDLELELPVMAEWSYQKLKISPCRYSGSPAGKDMVIMAHNYRSHFGNLSLLHPGAEIVFTDMDGAVWHYQMITTDILEPENVEEMRAGEYDLTLFTCTQGGYQRVTVRCNLK